jgi:hypothetical protein
MDKPGQGFFPTDISNLQNLQSLRAYGEQKGRTERERLTQYLEEQEKRVPVAKSRRPTVEGQAMNVMEFGNYPNRSARAPTRDPPSVILTRSRRRQLEGSRHVSRSGEWALLFRDCQKSRARFFRRCRSGGCLFRLMRRPGTALCRGPAAFEGRQVMPIAKSATPAKRASGIATPSVMTASGRRQ